MPGPPDLHPAGGRAIQARSRVAGSSAGAKAHGLGNKARTERHRKPGRPLGGYPHQLIENEHHGRGGHVAELSKHIAGDRERLRSKIESPLHGIENGFTAGMHRPKLDRFQGRLPEDLMDPALERLLNGGWNVTRESHVEALIAHMPGDEIPA